jgi:hypothetical protein
MIAWQQARPQWFQRLLYCDVERKWKNYHITTFPGQSLSPKNTRDASSGDKLKIALFGDLSLEEAMDLSRDRQILELEPWIRSFGRLQIRIIF